jgi:hypothetical protein
MSRDINGCSFIEFLGPMPGIDSQTRSGESLHLYNTLQWCILGDEGEPKPPRLNNYIGRFSHLDEEESSSLSESVKTAFRDSELIKVLASKNRGNRKSFFCEQVLATKHAIRHVSAHGLFCPGDTDDRRTLNPSTLRGVDEWFLSPKDGRSRVSLAELAERSTDRKSQLAEQAMTLLACNAGRKEVLDYITRDIGFGVAIGWDGYSYFTESMLFYLDFYLAWFWSFAATKPISPVQRAIRAFCHAFSVMQYRYESDRGCFEDLFEDAVKHGFMHRVPDREDRSICCHGFLPRISIREKVLDAAKYARERELLSLRCPNHFSIVKQG